MLSDVQAGNDLIYADYFYHHETCRKITENDALSEILQSSLLRFNRIILLS